MNVILLEPIDKVGEAGEMVKVKPGFARNFLIPQGLALLATNANKAELDARLAQRAKQLSERKSDAERLGEMLGDAMIEIKVRAGEERIYGSVKNRDIAQVVKDTFDIEIDRRKIDLREPIKTVGEYTIAYRPHPEVTIDLKVVIIPEEA
ncbi:MAG: 50S ribosomal protein L9 [Trueperaceae bacterium]|nr:MAG: 50S ribosomal protein L9 [Trueperaceae bacterium]